MVNYLRHVKNDYKSVAIDTRNDIRARPFRATLIGSCLVAAAYCARRNPTRDDFVDQLIDSNNRLSRVTSTTLNANSYEHIHSLFTLHNQKLLRYQSLGLFSVIYRADETEGVDLFEANCKYLRPTFRSYFTSRIVDIGFLGQFQRMRRQMIDYDVNEAEWKAQ